MTIYLPELDVEDFSFPSPYEALEEPNGLLAFGGDLHPERLINAYKNGVFPWFGPNEPLLWWSPSPRAVFEPENYKPSKSLKKFQRKHQYLVTINHNTEAVIGYCSSTRPLEETWLNEDMRAAYITLAKMGYCHSVEVWRNDELIGGLYGLSIGQVFCGESMFSLAPNASKIALWYFCHHFTQLGGKLIDCQVMNPHLKSLGALEMNRDDFLSRLQQHQQSTMERSCFLPQTLSLSIDRGENQ